MLDILSRVVQTHTTFKKSFASGVKNEWQIAPDSSRISWKLKNMNNEHDLAYQLINTSLPDDIAVDTKWDTVVAPEMQQFVKLFGPVAGWQCRRSRLHGLVGCADATSYLRLREVQGQVLPQTQRASSRQWKK